MSVNIQIKNQFCYYNDPIVAKYTRFIVPHPEDPFRKIAINLSSRDKTRFPLGLKFIVEKRLTDAGINYNIEDTNFYSYIDQSHKFSLRAYQKEALHKIFEKKQGILKHPTGSGKTRTAVCLANSIEGKVLFVVDTISLINQTAKAYTELTGDVANIVTSSNIILSKFNIATFQTMHSISKSSNLSKIFEDVTCLIVDECHILGAMTYYKAALSIPAPWRIGLSATPTDRTDSLDPLVVAATGGIVHSIPLNDLIAAKNLAEPHIIFYEYSNEKYKYETYHYKDVITLNRNRNIAILKLCRIAPKPCLLFFEYKDHGYLLQKNLRNLGISADIVHGLYKGAQREEAIQDLINGHTDILLTSKIFNKGVNIPELRSCINVAGLKAYIPTIQKLGRGTRRAENKDKIIYFELFDIENATTLSHSKERIEAYTSNNLIVEKFDNISSIKNYISAF